MTSVFVRSLAGLAAAAAALLARPAAHASDLPAAAPARAAGLWVIDEETTPVWRGSEMRTRKVWRVCLNRKADRALHELEAWEARARMAADGLRCSQPTYALADKVLTSAMQCRGKSTAGGAEISARLVRAMHFVSNGETRSETVFERDGDPHRRAVASMRRIGPCPDGMKPGARLMQHWKMNGDETLKGQVRSNIFQEVGEHRRFTAR